MRRPFDIAHCDGHDPELWFEKWSAPQAKAICAGCPSQQSCLDWALEQEWNEYELSLTEGKLKKIKAWGVYGGLDADARVSLLHQRLDDLAEDCAA